VRNAARTAPSEVDSAARARTPQQGNRPADLSLASWETDGGRTEIPRNGGLRAPSSRRNHSLLGNDPIGEIT